MTRAAIVIGSDSGIGKATAVALSVVDDGLLLMAAAGYRG